MLSIPTITYWQVKNKLQCGTYDTVVKNHGTIQSNGIVHVLVGDSQLRRFVGESENIVDFQNTVILTYGGGKVNSIFRLFEDWLVLSGIASYDIILVLHLVCGSNNITASNYNLTKTNISNQKRSIYSTKLVEELVKFEALARQYCPYSVGYIHQVVGRIKETGHESVNSRAVRSFIRTFGAKVNSVINILNTQNGFKRSKITSALVRYPKYSKKTNGRKQVFKKACFAKDQVHLSTDSNILSAVCILEVINHINTLPLSFFIQRYATCLNITSKMQIDAMNA